MIQSAVKIGLIGLAALGAAAAANASTNTAPNAGGFACGISKQVAGNTQTIEGVVQSPTSISGEYRFTLKSSSGGGTSNINQGGPFSAPAGTPVTVGQMNINADARIEATFTVTADGKTYDCSQQYGMRT